MQDASDPVADGQAGDAAADLDHRTDSFVAEDPAGLDLRHVTAQNVQVRAADGDRIDADDRISGVHDRRIGYVCPGTLTRAPIHKRFHEAPP